MSDKSGGCGGTKKFFLSAFVFFGLSVCAAPLASLAQGSRVLSPPARRIEQINRQSEEFERDRMNRELKGKNSRPSAADAKRAQAVRAQIKEDFEALQGAYNKIVLSLQSGDALDRNFVVETTAGIRKFAARLKENLALPAAEKEESKEAAPEPAEDAGDRRKALRALCLHIYKFLTNPIFNEPTAGLNVERASEARREMDKIIQLSDKIKEAAGGADN